MKRYALLLLMSLALLSLHTSVMAMVADYIDLIAIGQAFPLANGAKIRLVEKTVSADCTDTGGNFFYIQDYDYSAGIRVVPIAGLPAVARNQRVTVIGYLDTVNGERQISAIWVEISPYTSVIQSLAMDGLAVGGSAYSTETPGITDAAVGPYNKGLLITIWGRVQSVYDGFFYVSDGGWIQDDYYCPGIRVKCNNQTQPPALGQFVIVTGVCSSRQMGSNNYRLVLARDNNDIVYPTPETVTSTQSLGPLQNIVGIPCVPFYDSDDDPLPDAYHVFSGYATGRWDPTYQYWTSTSTVYSDEGYLFAPAGYNPRDPANPATITYTGVKSVIEQKARYIPLYAAESGTNWIGFPYSTGVISGYAMVADGAFTTTYYNATSTGMVDAYCHQYVNETQREERMDVQTGMFQPWHAYKFTSHEKCALILPAPCVQIDISDPPAYVLTPCSDYPITATARNTQGAPLANCPVTFYTSHGEFTENGSTSVQAITDANGLATVHFYGSDCGERADIYASASGCRRKHVSETIHVFYEQWKLTLMLSHCEILSGDPVTATARLVNCAREPVVGQAIELTTTSGTFTDGVNNYGTTYTTATAANGEITIDLALTGCPVTATVTAEAVNLCTKDYIDTEQVTTLCENIENDDWPMFMHDPQHTGLSSTWDDMTQNLQLVWSQPVPCANTIRWDGAWPTEGVWHVNYVSHPQPSPKYVLEAYSSYIFEHPFIDSSPVAVGGTVVVGAWDGTYLASTGYVRAFNAANNGSTIWTASGSPVQMGGVASTPCIYNGLVFVGSADGKLYCLDLATGQQYWANQTTDRSNPAGNSRILSSPVVHQGKVYIINEASKIYAFTADTTGSLVGGYPVVLPIEQHLIQPDQLTFTGGSSSPATAVVNNIPYLLVGCDDGYLYRLRLTDRNLQMIYLDGCVESSPSISTKTNTGFVGVSVYKGEDVVRFSIEPFKVITTWRLHEESRASVSLAANGCAYNGVDTGTYLYKLDADAEKAQGFHYLERFGTDDVDHLYWYFVGSAAHTRSVGEGLVYTGNDNGRLYELGEDRLNARREIQLGNGFVSSSPAISYNVDPAGNRWVFITGRGDYEDRIYAFRALR